MKIIFWLGIGFDRHGPSVHLLKSMMEECLLAGHSVVVIEQNTGGNNPDIPIELQKYDRITTEVYKMPTQQKGAFLKSYIYHVGYYYKTQKFLYKHKDADVVFLQSCYLPIVPINMIHRMGVPVLFNVQNIFPIDAGILGMLPTKGLKGIPYHILRKVQQKAYGKADLNVTISEDMRKTLLTEKAPEDKLEVIYNWSYSDDTAIIPDKENLFLKQHREFMAKFRVVFAGNLGAMVNPTIFAEAAERLKAYKDIVFIIIGDGNNMNKLKNMVREKGIDNVAFFGYQPEEFARHNYAMAHVNINALPQGIITTCMPSKTATMLNAAKPMVVAVEKDSDYAKILCEVDKCTVVDWNDVEGFADAILNIYHQGGRPDSNNSREVFRKKCSTENAKQYVRLLEKTANMRE